MRCILVVDAVRASGKNDAERIKLLNLVNWDVKGMNLGIDPQLSDAARYELGILPAKIQNEEQFLVFHAKNIAKNRANPKSRPEYFLNLPATFVSFPEGVPSGFDISAVKISTAKNTKTALQI